MMATEVLALLTAGWTGLTTALLLGTMLGFIVGLLVLRGGDVGGHAGSIRSSSSA